uniref:Alternative protein PNPLA5 n=1 Tax=Homo sapiens TaxID=9606 RepID=L8ECM6_HUMAN|nr:alternative protein PNPLA5 [Homo sapiens]
MSYFQNFHGGTRRAALLGRGAPVLPWSCPRSTSQKIEKVPDARVRDQRSQLR